MSGALAKLRALSFISGHLSQSKKRKDSSDSSSYNTLTKPPSSSHVVPKPQQNGNGDCPPPPPPHGPSPTSSRGSPPPGAGRSNRSSGRPASAIFPDQQQPLMDVQSEQTPELEPIFNYLNSQMNKLYYEGYLLRLNDLDAQGRPYTERQWVECFAQLIGSVLWMWDAAALDESEDRGDVHPTHINVADATVKMVETLPTRFKDNQPLQNVLSLSTAGKNRYLFHFNSHNSLTQWTAAIRLTMYENTLLQESYTGALIAGKGKRLNNMKAILERTRFKHEEWVRVRFSPGTPWKRCWCVISPPDEKVVQKVQKAEKKKRSSYERSNPVIKGTVKFYPTQKTKKVKPLITINDAYSAFAIYPQSKSLVDQSTLIKLEGSVTIHSRVESSTEGFVFVLPELHPAVSGVEIMLRWLFPFYDAFHLYGRPTRLLADTVSTRSLMFAMPKSRRNAYLDNLDVANLIHTDGSQHWTEQEWRKRLKDATSRRMASKNSSRESSVRESRVGQRSSYPKNGTAVRFGDNPVASRLENNYSSDAVFASGQRQSGAPMGQAPPPEAPPEYYGNGHGGGNPPSRTSLEKAVPEEAEENHTLPPPPPPHRIPQYDGAYESAPVHNRGSSDSSDGGYLNANPNPNHSDNMDLEHLRPSPQPSPVMAPPAFSHSPGEVPQNRPRPSSDMKRAHTRVSNGTLAQMAEMSRQPGMAAAGAAAAWSGNKQQQHQQQHQPPPPPTGSDQRNSMGPPGSRAPAIENNGPSGTLGPGNIPNQSTFPVSPVSPLHNDERPNSSKRYSRPTSLDQNGTNPHNVSPKAVTARKPLPQSAPDVDTRSNTPTTSSSLASFGPAVDANALRNIMDRDRSPSPQRKVEPRMVKVEKDESIYDQSSVGSPDYASSHYSSKSKRSMESLPKQRMGVMKVVGTPEEPQAEDVMIGDSRFKPAAPAPETPNPDIPSIDFGPTHTYSPETRRPNSADTLTMLGHHRNKSDATLGVNERNSPSGGRSTPGTGSGNRRTESPGYGDERRKSLLWQPGMISSGRQSPGPNMTAEEFVQQRAEGHRTGTPPAYPHRRGPSHNLSNTRPASGDWTTFTRQQSGRNSPQRPHSRGASVTLNHTDISPRLSAREQEHLARTTGSSFFNMTQESANRSSQSFGPGLVGAIDSRERERKAMKEGVSGHMVQQAIAQRQHQPQYSNSSPQLQHQPHSQYPASMYPPTIHNRSPSASGSNLLNQYPHQETRWAQQAQTYRQNPLNPQAGTEPSVHQEYPQYPFHR